MADAINWSESDDPLTRDFAVTVFEDIGTPEALKNLKTLAADPDPSVAVGAKDGLDAARGGPASAYEVDSTPWAASDN
jgi:HEAT repeat protein